MTASVSGVVAALKPPAIPANLLRANEKENDQFAACTLVLGKLRKQADQRANAAVDSAYKEFEGPMGQIWGASDTCYAKKALDALLTEGTADEQLSEYKSLDAESGC